MKKGFIFLYCVFIVLEFQLVLFCSRIASNYFAVQANIDPLSKNASFLTLLFMLFAVLGIIICILHLFIFRKYLKK